MMTQALFDIYFRYWKRAGWFGNYISWSAAKLDTQGYNADAIFEKVINAARQVKQGNAAFERDGIVFSEKEHSHFLLAAVKKIQETEKELRVLDFGGSIGSTYFQHRDVLKNLKSWVVVEQEHFVKAGKAEFEDWCLKFENSLEKAFETHRPNLILINSVLQYIEKPYELLAKIKALGAENIVIERTPVADFPTDRITKQIVPPKIYDATYPSWVFAFEQFCPHIISEWHFEKVNMDKYGHFKVGGKDLYYINYFLQPKNTAATPSTTPEVIAFR